MQIFINKIILGYFELFLIIISILTIIFYSLLIFILGIINIFFEELNIKNLKELFQSMYKNYKEFVNNEDNFLYL